MEFSLIISILALIISGLTAFQAWRKDKRELRHAVKSRISSIIGTYISLRGNFEILNDKLRDINTPVDEINRERQLIIEDIGSPIWRAFVKRAGLPRYL